MVPKNLHELLAAGGVTALEHQAAAQAIEETRRLWLPILEAEAAEPDLDLYTKVYLAGEVSVCGVHSVCRRRRHRRQISNGGESRTAIGCDAIGRIERPRLHDRHRHRRQTRKRRPRFAIEWPALRRAMRSQARKIAAPGQRRPQASSARRAKVGHHHRVRPQDGAAQREQSRWHSSWPPISRSARQSSPCGRPAST
jgi:hypothetical protein